MPDLHERTTFACGPAGLLDALAAHHDELGLPLLTEQFRVATVVAGEGGTVSFADDRHRPSSRPTAATPILDAAEDAGVLMPSGCRMGICYGCVLPLREGAVRDLRTGEITTAGETARRRPDPDLHQRRRRRLRHRPLTSAATRSTDRRRSP